MANKDVFVVDPPSADAPGAYILIVQRGHGVFGSSSTAFAVDSLVTTPAKHQSIKAYQGDKLVVEFSPESSYVMIARDLTRATNMTELELHDRREAKINQALIEAEFPETAAKVDADAIERPGNYL